MQEAPEANDTNTLEAEAQALFYIYITALCPKPRAPEAWSRQAHSLTSFMERAALHELLPKNGPCGSWKQHDLSRLPEKLHTQPQTVDVKFSHLQSMGKKISLQPMAAPPRREVR